MPCGDEGMYSHDDVMTAIEQWLVVASRIVNR